MAKNQSLNFPTMQVKNASEKENKKKLFEIQEWLEYYINIYQGKLLELDEDLSYKNDEERRDALKSKDKLHQAIKDAEFSLKNVKKLNISRFSKIFFKLVSSPFVFSLFVKKSFLKLFKKNIEPERKQKKISLTKIVDFFAEKTEPDPEFLVKMSSLQIDHLNESIKNKGRLLKDYRHNPKANIYISEIVRPGASEITLKKLDNSQQKMSLEAANYEIIMSSFDEAIFGPNPLAEQTGNLEEAADRIKAEEEKDGINLQVKEVLLQMIRQYADYKEKFEVLRQRIDQKEDNLAQEENSLKEIKDSLEETIDSLSDKDSDIKTKKREDSLRFKSSPDARKEIISLEIELNNLIELKLSKEKEIAKKEKNIEDIRASLVRDISPSISLLYDINPFIKSYEEELAQKNPQLKKENLDQVIQEARSLFEEHFYQEFEIAKTYKKHIDFIKTDQIKSIFFVVIFENNQYSLVIIDNRQVGNPPSKTCVKVLGGKDTQLVKSTIQAFPVYATKDSIDDISMSPELINEIIATLGSHLMYNPSLTVAEYSKSIDHLIKHRQNFKANLNFVDHIYNVILKKLNDSDQNILQLEAFKDLTSTEERKAVISNNKVRKSELANKYRYFSGNIIRKIMTKIDQLSAVSKLILAGSVLSACMAFLFSPLKNTGLYQNLHKTGNFFNFLKNSSLNPIGSGSKFSQFLSFSLSFFKYAGIAAGTALSFYSSFYFSFLIVTCISGGILYSIMKPLLLSKGIQIGLFNSLSTLIHPVKNNLFGKLFTIFSVLFSKNNWLFAIPTILTVTLITSYSSKKGTSPLGKFFSKETFVSFKNECINVIRILQGYFQRFFSPNTPKKFEESYLELRDLYRKILKINLQKSTLTREEFEQEKTELFILVKKFSNLQNNLFGRFSTYFQKCCNFQLLKQARKEFKIVESETELSLSETFFDNLDTRENFKKAKEKHLSAIKNLFDFSQQVRESFSVEDEENQAENAKSFSDDKLNKDTHLTDEVTTHNGPSVKTNEESFFSVSQEVSGVNLPKVFPKNSDSFQERKKDKNLLYLNSHFGNKTLPENCSNTVGSMEEVENNAPLSPPQTERKLSEETSQTTSKPN